jgi:large repetitive protein
MRKFSLLSIALLLIGAFSFNYSFAQKAKIAEPVHSETQKCKFDEIHQNLMQNDAFYRQITEDFEQQILSGQLNMNRMMSGSVYKVPVVVHVLHSGEAIGTGWNISDEQVKKGIEYLNNYWRKVAGTPGGVGPGADMEVEFALAVRDPSNNCTNGIVRRNMSSFTAYVNNGVGSGGITEAEAKNGRWDTQNYYNIYLVNKIDGANCFTGGAYTAGYAYFPSSHGSTSDGTVCLTCSYTDESSNTMAHELGHAFGLYHTFEGNTSSCTSETNCATNGDRCCDTRPHRQTDCGSTGCTGSGTIENSVNNYMSYCNTTERFTADQKTRARSSFDDLVRRGKFLEANGNNKLVPPSGATVNFYASGTGGCTGTAIKFMDNSFCVPNTYATSTGWTNHTFSWSVTGPVNLNSSLQNPTFTFNTAGTYSVSLTITNLQGTFTHTKTNYIVISGPPSGGTNACTPTSTNVGNFAQTVNNVTFKDINNATSTSTNAAYTNFSCTRTTTVTEGESHQLTVSLRSGASGREFVEVWIDWNNNGVIDAGETVLTGSTPSTNTTTNVSANITIPATAVKNTILRMRVMGETSAAPSTQKKSCSTAYFIGDVEDYGVVVLSSCGAVTSTTPGERCGTGSVALGASGQGTFNWYAAASGGSSLGTGSTFNTPSISTNTTYYVDATFSSCTSTPRTAVTASINSPVAQATLVSPANGATSVSATPTYNWNALSGASSYDVQVATDAGFTTIVTNTNVATNSYVQSPALSNNTTYYWRVRGVNGCGAGTYSSTFSFTTQNIACSTVASTNVPVTIPTSISTVSSTLNFTTNVSITDVNVLNLQGTHTWINDLRFRLRAPDGTEIILLQNICADQDNFNINFDDSGSPYANIPCPPTNGSTYQPLNALSAFNGKSSQGTWTLFIDDIASGDGGSLSSWSLQICGESCTAPAQPGTITGNTTVCSGSTNTYSIGSVSGATGYTWTVPSGATINSGQGTTSISVTFGTSSGNVSVTANNACGSSTARTSAITVNTVPAQPSTISGLTTPCQGSSQTYSVISVAGVTYNWTFPSGWTQTAGGTTNSVTVTVGSTSGNVTVTPSNACGNGTARSLSTTVNTVPAQPSTISGLTTPCQGSSQTYSVTSVAGVTYNWTFPSGWTQTAGGTTNSVTVTVGSTSGNVTVTPSNACGNGTARSLSTTVNIVPAQPSTITGLATPCEGSSQTYSVTNVAGVTYNWIFPSGWTQTAGGTTNSVTVTVGSTSGNVTVTPSNACGNGTARSLSTTVNTVPAQPSTISGLNTPCQGSSQTYSVTNVAGVAYNWMFPSGWTQTAGGTTNSVTVTVGSTSGNVTVTPSNACGNGTARSLSTTVNTVPAQPSTITGLATPCQGSSQTYSVTNVAGVTYNWIFPSGWTQTAGGTTNSVTVTVGSTSGNVTVTPSNACGNGTARSLSTTVNTVPAQPSTISGLNTPCQGSSQTYSVTNVAGVTYNWIFPSGWTQTAGGTTNSVTVTVGSTSGNVTVTPSNACGNGTARSLSTTVNTVPAQPSTISGLNTPCQGSSQTYSVTSVAGVTYNWTFPSGWTQTAGGTTNSVTVTVGSTSGNVTVTPSNACGNGTARSLSTTVNTVPATPGTISGATSACAGSSQTYSISSVAGATSYTWTVPSGSTINSGAGTTSINVTLGSNSGNVTVTASNTCGTSSASTLGVSITTTVTPSVSIAITSGTNPTCSGSAVTFTATPANGGTTPSYQWKLNGGNVGTNSSVFTSSTLNSGDEITCELTSNDPCASPLTATSNTITMTVNSIPAQPGTITGNTTVCSGSTNTYSISSVSGATGYTWTIPSGAIINSGQGTTSISVTFGTISGNVSVAADNSCGSSTVRTSAITVNTVPAQPSTISGTTTPCQGSSQTYSVTSVGGVTYNWTFPSGWTQTAGGTTNSVTVTVGSTSGDVIVTPSNSCGNGTARSLSTTVNTAPATPGSISGATSACAGSSQTYSISSVAGATSYTWTVPSGSTINSGAGTTSINVTLGSNSGNVTVTASNTCGTSSANTLGVSITTTVTPSVSIAITSGTNPTCSGSSVTFTATPANGGTTPSYQWKRNGSNVGTNSSTFTTSTLTNGDLITCELTSNDPCANPLTATSNTIEMTVNATVTPSVSISVSPSSTINSGDNATFTATPTNGGSTPIYQWRVNGGNVGTNSNTFSSTTLNNGDIVSCILTSNATCATSPNATSNSITMTVNSAQDVSVSISISSGSNPICSGSSITFSALATGTNINYQWRVNGSNVGTNSSTFSSSSLVDGNIISCLVTANEGSETSNSITLYDFVNLRSTSNITSNSAVFNWNPDLTSNGYRLTVINASTGKVHAAVNLPASTSTYTMTGLFAGTSYRWNVRYLCGSSYLPATIRTKDITNFTTTSGDNVCIRPLNGPVTSITDTSAIVSWNNIICDSIEVRYRPTDLSDAFRSVFKVYNGNNTRNVTKLQPNKEYLWYVSAWCNGVRTEFSQASYFTTMGSGIRLAQINIENESIETIDDKTNIEVKDVYPNPATDRLYVNFETRNEKKVVVQMFDMLGKKLIEKEVVSNSGNNQLELHIEDLPATMYLVKIITSNSEDKFRVVKQ